MSAPGPPKTPGSLIRSSAEACCSLELNGGDGLFADVHEQDAELFYILAGTGVYSDDGTETDVRAGDVAIFETGHGHSIANTGEDTLEFVAVIVYA